jgi:hypothetical protein
MGERKEDEEEEEEKKENNRARRLFATFLAAIIQIMQMNAIGSFQMEITIYQSYSKNI